MEYSKKRVLRCLFITLALPPSATRSTNHESTTRSSSSSSMSAGRKTTYSKNAKNLEIESGESSPSTPSGRKKFRKNGDTSSKASFDYVNLVNEDILYETFDSANNVEEKDRYTISNDNSYMNSQVNFANCEVCTIVDLCIIILHLLNRMLLV